MGMKGYWAIPVIASILILGTTYTVYAMPVTIDFTTLGTFTSASVVQPGVTVTGSNTVNVLNLNGLGIVGGAFNSRIDGSESITFTFDNPASDVSYLVIGAGNLNADGLVGAATIEAFDSGGISLGTIPVDLTGVKEVSMNFGNELISKFTVTADVDSILIGTVTFNLDNDDQLIGGILIPIDTTALLIAGAQMNAIWIIPVIGAVGAIIAIYKLKRK